VHLTIGTVTHLLHDLKAMQIVVGQRQEDLEPVGLEGIPGSSP
jgi:hypothetical protein